MLLIIEIALGILFGWILIGLLPLIIRVVRQSGQVAKRILVRVIAPLAIVLTGFGLGLGSILPLTNVVPDWLAVSTGLLITVGSVAIFALYLRRIGAKFRVCP